jgi:TRAP-type C4-dicarboxylate transport system permease small subunit|tara:strand:- start:1442 stop:2008 length:567 start_codon:yes stop_codon:yes gene_type:complete
LLEIINKKLTKVEDFLIIFSGVSIFIVMILTSFQIISRVMGYPWPGYLELSELSISIFAFLGVAYAQRVDSHIRMELIVGNLKGRIRWFLEFCATLIGFIVIIILIKYSFLFALDSYQIGDTTYDYLYPTWPAKLLVPIAFSIWALRLLIEIFGYLRMLVFVNVEPLGIPVIKTAEELANEEIKVIRD